MKSKSYYWTISSEIALYANHDVEKASHCLLKAAEFDDDNIQWRIILSKVLLERFRDLLSNSDTSGSISSTFPTELDNTSFNEAIQVSHPPFSHSPSLLI
jgi:hypothetical protein